MKQEYQQFIQEQEILRKLVQEKIELPPRLSLSGEAFYEPQHKDQGCLCTECFAILRCSLYISKWQDSKIYQIKFVVKKLIQQGYVSGLIITEVAQLSYVRDH